jgi:hypothetical protein
MKLNHLLLFFLCLPIQLFAQYNEDIDYVKEFTTERKVYYKENILISEKNISMILNGLPDIRCFDSTGKELQTRNCMSAISEIVDEVSSGKCKEKTGGETLEHYLSQNTIIDMDGSIVTAALLPKKEYYLFYSFTPKLSANVSQELIDDMWSTLGNAIIKSRNSKSCQLYAICILGIALNGVTRMK